MGVCTCLPRTPALLSEKVKKTLLLFYSVAFLYIRPAAGLGDGVGESRRGGGKSRRSFSIPRNSCRQVSFTGKLRGVTFSGEEELWHLLVATSVLVTTYPRTENILC